MVLVDTTVWIDFFRGDATPQVAALERLIAEKQDLCVCGIVLTEVLQGIRDDRRYKQIKGRFDDLIFLPMSRMTFVKSAEMYRSLRKKGITVRKPVDCMIAAVAITHKVQLLHNDRDFNPLQKHFGLKVAGTGKGQP